MNKHEAGAVYPVGLKRCTHRVEIEGKCGRNRLNGAGSRARLENQNAVVDARYRVAEQVPYLRCQQRVMRTSVAGSKSERRAFWVGQKHQCSEVGGGAQENRGQSAGSTADAAAAAVAAAAAAARSFSRDEVWFLET